MTEYREYLSGNGGRIQKLLAIFAMTLIASVAMALPAKADLTAVGNVDDANHFPSYFQDQDGLRLGLCLGANCLASIIENRAPNDEAFWFNAGAAMDTPGGDALLVLATEAAYAGPGDGQEIAFNRVRVRADVDQPGTYLVTHPYGELVVSVDSVDAGAPEINETDDQGCLVPPCGDFAAARTGAIGPTYLTWDTFGLDPAAGGPPTGFIGDAITEHAVKGSPTGNNLFRIDEVDPDTGTVIRTLNETDQFTVQGKIAGLAAFASPKGGLFNQDQTVTLKASDPDPAVKIVYTTGPTPAATPEPAVDADGVATGTSTVVSPGSSVNLTETTTLKFKAFKTGVTPVESPVVTETYNIDKVAPDTLLAPDLADASDSGASNTDNLTNNTSLTFNGNAEAGSTVRLFEGSTQIGSGPATGGSYSISVGGLSEGVHDITARATDAAGNTSVDSGALIVTIDTTRPRVTANPEGGIIGPTRQVSLTSNEAADIFFTKDLTDPDPGGTLYTGPLSFSVNTTLKYMAEDTAGNQSQVATQVYTIDSSAPIISGRSPRAGATGVLIGSNVRATFNEAVMGVSGTTFKLRRGTTTIPAVVTYNATSRTAVLNPKASLAHGKKYTVVLTSGIKDKFGNALTVTSWSFTTK